MTLEAMVLSLYMLFPVISSQQRQLEEHYLECNAGAREEISDDGGAALLASLEEWAASIQDFPPDTGEEGIPVLNLEMLENPEFGPQSEASALAMGLEEESYAEVFYRNSLNRLALFSYGEEYFAPAVSLDGSNAIVNVNSAVTVRNVYDDSFRLTEKITWKNASTLRDSVMLSRVSYSYSTPSSSFPIRERQELYDRQQVNDILYSADGKVLQFERYSKAAKSSREKLEQKIVYDYDAQGRVTKEESSDLVQDGGRFIVRRREYDYVREGVNPNVRYFEDGVLRLQTEYGEDDGTYVETVFFDGDFSIKSGFKDGIKVSETVYHAGQEYGGLADE